MLDLEGRQKMEYIAHGPTDGGPWLSGCKRPFTDRVVFCSATEVTVVDFISNLPSEGGGGG